jgi:hypothetical protein
VLNRTLSVWFALGLVGSLVGCSSNSDAGDGPDQASQCKAINATQCKKIWECESGASLPASQFGTDEASCEQLRNMDCNDPMPCQDGYTWDFANGDQCIKDFSALTCDQYNALTAPPTSCADACKQK